MTRFELLDELVEKGNGYLQTSQVLENGISKPTLADYVNKRNMERVAQGVYLAEDAWKDELYILHLSNSRIIFSHETALFLHGLMEREPKDISVTVRAGYNASHLRKKGIRVYQVKPEIEELGVLDIQTNFDNTVRAYDMERTICDVIRYKEAMDVQVFQYAMKEYMGSTHKNLNHLMTYAKKLHIESAVRTYTEVML
ncbi:MAG: type IV toxin-antitoxin system AbiEi family antitoxin domain-containing protein [Erysipelotrichaceae bacterium]|nr:type IV toxin-antitoxin system AbiEi family antitoxin domain-containing protein [Erysipelotrichaceae bacterium]